MGFGVVTMIGSDIAKAQVDDIAIKTTHSGFILEHKLTKMQDGPNGWQITK
jgi:hypothetical protein